MTHSQSGKVVRKGALRNRFVAIDFETADNGPDSACAIGLVVVEQMRIVDSHYSLLRPPRRKFRYSGIHGITWDQVVDAPIFSEYWPKIAKVIRGAEFLAAHNAPFDRNVLRACCEAARISPPRLPFRCTVRLAKETWELPSAKLALVCEHLGIELDHHHALSDAMACARIVIEAHRASANR